MHKPLNARNYRYIEIMDGNLEISTLNNLHLYGFHNLIVSVHRMLLNILQKGTTM